MSSASKSLQAEAGLKRVFNVKQKRYYDSLKAEMAQIANGRTPLEMHAEKDVKSLRLWTERRRKAIEFLETKKMPGKRIEQIEEAAKKMKEFFKERAKGFRVKPPELQETLAPIELTENHLEALDEVFGMGNLEPVIMPEPESLDNDYFEMMFPKEQREEDKARGLISYRPKWWEEEANAGIFKPKKETWGEVFIRSMKAEAERLQGKIIFTESIRRPEQIYEDSQQYGTKEGKDKTKDPLLAIIKGVFGDKVSRFSLSWDEINMRLLPKVKEEIEKKFEGEGLEVPSFEVMITPALVRNEQITEKHPENSRSYTNELTSTVFQGQDGKDTGLRVVLGYHGEGGISCFRSYPQSIRTNCGFCLLVVFG